MAKRTSIFKMIGSQSARHSTAKRIIDYIFDKKKTHQGICDEQYLDLNEPMDAWETHPMRKTAKERQFIHALLCPYGKKVPTQEDLKHLSKGLLQIFGDYPSFTAIHEDRPKSPHIHMVIHPRNILTNKVWQQSPSDLKVQKEKISVLLEALGFYGINSKADGTSKSSPTIEEYNYSRDAALEEPLDDYADSVDEDNDFVEALVETDIADNETNIMDFYPFTFKKHNTNRSNPSNIMKKLFGVGRIHKLKVFTNISNGLTAINLINHKELTNVHKK